MSTRRFFEKPAPMQEFNMACEYISYNDRGILRLCAAFVGLSGDDQNNVKAKFFKIMRSQYVEPKYTDLSWATVKGSGAKFKDLCYKIPPDGWHSWSMPSERDATLQNYMFQVTRAYITLCESDQASYYRVFHETISDLVARASRKYAQFGFSSAVGVVENTHAYGLSRK